MGRLIGSWTGTTALVLSCAVGLAACSTLSKPTVKHAGFGSVPPPAASKVSGGTVSYGMLPGQTPGFIFPITPAAKSSAFTIYDFQYLMWRPLYWPRIGTEPAIDYGLSLAAAPVFSNGDKTVTVRLNDRYRWSNGQPATARDVLFSIDLLKAAVGESSANWGNYTPGFFPSNVVSASSPDARTVVMQLDRPYNPGWFDLDQLSLIVPLPAAAWARTSLNGPAVDFTVPANAKRIYDFLTAQSNQVGSYATIPLWQVVDGPFKLVSFSASTGSNALVPNPAYGGAKASIARLEEVAYTSNVAEVGALLSHQLTVGQIPGQDVPQVHRLSKVGYHFFGYPNFGWSYLPFNFKDTTGHWNSIVAQPYIRQALAHLVNQSAYINGIYSGAAEPAYGPVPSLPVSQFTPSDAKTDLYPYSIAAAKSLLTAHGWHVVPSGTDTCARPGTSARQCGAGIPAGTAFSLNLIYDSMDSSISTEDMAFASAARSAGVEIHLVGKAFNTIIETYNNPSAPANSNAWAMEDFGGIGLPLYPTTNGIFNSTGSFNFGSYHSAEADALIRASVYGANASAVSAEAAFLTRDLPALFLPDGDTVVAWSKKLSGAPNSFSGLTQSSFTPESWYFTK
jgi:peptide/nickel transport system substrate-binding protein